MTKEIAVFPPHMLLYLNGCVKNAITMRTFRVFQTLMVMSHMLLESPLVLQASLAHRASVDYSSSSGLHVPIVCLVFLQSFCTVVTYATILTAEILVFWDYWLDEPLCWRIFAVDGFSVSTMAFQIIRCVRVRGTRTGRRDGGYRQTAQPSWRPFAKSEAFPCCHRILARAVSCSSPRSYTTPGPRWWKSMWQASPKSQNVPWRSDPTSVNQAGPLK